MVNPLITNGTYKLINVTLTDYILLGCVFCHLGLLSTNTFIIRVNVHKWQNTYNLHKEASEEGKKKASNKLLVTISLALNLILSAAMRRDKTGGWEGCLP